MLTRIPSISICNYSLFSKNGQCFSFFQEYTMDVISRIAMGQNGSKMFNNPMSKYANLVIFFHLLLKLRIIQIFNRNMAHPVSVTAAVFPSLKPFWYWLIHKIGPVHRAAAQPMFAQIYKTVDERIAQRVSKESTGIAEKLGKRRSGWD